MSINTFLVDTSAWILALRKDFSPGVKERIDHLLKENTVITTGMVKLEILGGTKTKSEFLRLKRRLDALDSVDLDTSLWEESYDLAFKLRRKGITVPYTDILIAACALKIGSTVVHVDAHFDLMAGHISLKVESFVPNVKSLDT
jgi:predicted nucleic acid-binding protein